MRGGSPREPPHHANRPTSPLNPYFSSACARRGYKAAVVAVAHRLCRILFAMVRQGTKFDIEKLGVEVGPFETSGSGCTASRPDRRRRGKAQKQGRTG